MEGDSNKKPIRSKEAARILELEYEVASLENFLRNHSDNEGIHEMRSLVEEKNSRIERLEYTVAEFEDFLKENPDVKDLHELKRQVTSRDRRIQELENWIERNGDVRIEKTRIMELEEMVTNLEDYVRSHNVDALKLKLQDREDRIKQLEKIVDIMKEEANMNRPTGGEINDSTKNSVSLKSLENSLQEKTEKLNELEKSIVVKDNKIKACEDQVHESQEKITKLQKEMSELEKELAEYEAQDIGVLKEEIRVRDERVMLLEEEIDSLERAFSDRIDLEQIEELVKAIKEKEETENRLKNDLREEREKKEELAEALRSSVVITSEAENKLKQVHIAKRNALERVGKLEQRIASMQTASALQCQTCQPLLSQLHKSEKKLERLAEKRRSQLKDLRQIKREALRAALSEKDAHLALLELSGLKTATQADQADKLRADKSRLLDKLKHEDKRSIEISEESDDSCTTTTTGLLTRILEPPLAKDEDYDLDNICEVESLSDSERDSDETNGHANDDGSIFKQRRR